MSLFSFYLVYLLALLPAVFIAYYIYQKDLYPEDRKEVIVTFLLGSSIVMFLHLLIPLVESFSYFFYSDVARSAYFSFFRAATLEEVMKFLVLYLYSYKLSNFSEPMDAVVFSTAASLGFAAVENIDYVMNAIDDYAAFNLALMRAFSAVPLHAFCVVVMGIFFGKAIFSPKNNKHYLFLSLAAPIFIHGLYNFMLSIGVLFLVYALLIFLFVKLTKIIDTLRLEQTKLSSDGLEHVYEPETNLITANIIKISVVTILGCIFLDVNFT